MDSEAEETEKRILNLKEYSSRCIVITISMYTVSYNPVHSEVHSTEVKCMGKSSTTIRRKPTKDGKKKYNY